MKRLALIILTFVIHGFLNAQSEKSSIVIVVNKNNTISSLSKEQLIDLYMGKYIAFPDGSSAIPVELDESTELKQNFYQQLVGLSLARINAYWSRIRFTGRASPPRALATESEVIGFVASEPQAISYIYERDLTPQLKVVYRFGE